MLENNVCNVSYIVLSFMSIIIRCCLVLCYLFTSVVIMFIGRINDRLFNFFSFLYLRYVYLVMYNMCVSIYVENRVSFDLILMKRLPMLDKYYPRLCILFVVRNFYYICKDKYCDHNCTGFILGAYSCNIKSIPHYPECRTPHYLKCKRVILYLDMKFGD